MKASGGNSLPVQWLGLPGFTAEGLSQSLVGELRSHKPRSMSKKEKKKVIECLLSVSPYSVLFKYGSFYPHSNSMI